MAITDPVQQTLEAALAILEADTELRTLFGRTSVLVVPWETYATSTALPVLVYLPVTAVPLWEGVQRLELQFSCFAATTRVANLAVVRAHQVLTLPAFTARGVSVARDPDSAPVRTWPSADALLSDDAERRADISLTFLLPD